MARPTSYQAEYANVAKKLCKLGLTDEELAEFFDVCVATIYNWKNQHPEFLEATKAGKLIADAEVATKLYERAIGYRHPEVKINVVNGEIVQTNVTRHYPPDTMAGIYWLNNRRRANWKQRAKEEDDSGDHKIIIEHAPDGG